MREKNIVLVHQALWGQNAKATNIFSVASSRSITWKIGTVCPFLVHSWTSQNMPTITKRGVYSPVIISIRIPISARAGAQLVSGTGADAACLPVSVQSHQCQRHRMLSTCESTPRKGPHARGECSQGPRVRLFRAHTCGETLRRMRRDSSKNSRDPVPSPSATQRSKRLATCSVR